MGRTIMIRRYKNYLRVKKIIMTLTKVFNVFKNFAEGFCIGYGVYAIIKKIRDYFKIKQLRREYEERKAEEEEERKSKSIFSK